MASSKPKQTIAFFGATGQCLLTTLSLCLEAGYSCTALARTPEKLSAALKEEKSPTENLAITPGDISNISAIKKVLAPENVIVDMFICGIGARGTYSGKPLSPIALDKTISRRASGNILTALRELNSEKRPVVIVISTIGIRRDGIRDVPRLLSPLYKLVLADACEDLKAVEDLLMEESGKEERVISGAIFVRPSLLTDGPRKGTDKVRTGTEILDPNVSGNGTAALGYSISRADVGGWIYERLVQNDHEEYLGKAIEITY